MEEENAQRTLATESEIESTLEIDQEPVKLIKPYSDFMGLPENSILEACKRAGPLPEIVIKTKDTGRKAFTLKDNDVKLLRAMHPDFPNRYSYSFTYTTKLISHGYRSVFADQPHLHIAFKDTDGGILVDYDVPTPDYVGLYFDCDENRTIIASVKMKPIDWYDRWCAMEGGRKPYKVKWTVTEGRVVRC